MWPVGIAKVRESYLPKLQELFHKMNYKMRFRYSLAATERPTFFDQQRNVGKENWQPDGRAL